MCHIIFTWKLFHTWDCVCMESRVFVQHFVHHRLRDVELFTLLFTLIFFGSKQKPASCHSLQLVELIAVCSLSLYAASSIEMFHPWQNGFTRSISFTVSCSELPWNICNWFCFCCPVAVLLRFMCAHPCLLSIKFGIWDWFSQKVFKMWSFFLKTSHIWCWFSNYTLTHVACRV
jgi:hypothetical protein